MNSINTNSGPPSRPTVAVIGGGPSAMFICHSLETQRKELESKGEDTSAFPIVKVFERAARPGGVWRSDRSHNVDDEGDGNTEEKKDDSDVVISRDSKMRKIERSTPERSANMYSALWTNGYKEGFEFYDYTFRDHFGDVQMPIYLPRKHVLGYMLARVTKKCPDFFERYFHFRTTVRNVKYLEDESKFRVCTFNDATQEEHVELFDKCVWAAGDNGTPQMPKQLLELFHKGGFPGRVLHSTDTSTFKEDVEGKHVLMIGGEFSVEDLALVAIKEGVKKISIASRSSEPWVATTTRWPYDKVELIKEVAVESVKGREVTFGRVKYSARKNTYLFIDEDDYCDDYQRVVLSDIDTVIFCTGYRMNMSMLDPALTTAMPGMNGNSTVSISKDWTPKEDALSLKLLGNKFLDMRPANHRVSNIGGADYFGLSDKLYYTTFCIDNPNMMYIRAYAELPLLDADLTAWMVAKVVSNQIPLPSAEEMRKENFEIVGRFLQCNSVRYDIDYRYQEAMDEAIEEYSEEVKTEDWEKYEYLTFWATGRKMSRFGYPVSFISGEDEAFSKFYKHTEYNYELDWYGRQALAKHVYDTKHEKDGWKSFRDTTVCTTSFFTGIKAVPLPKPWEEIHEDDVLW